jgi:membrane protein YdbS with pleckstrin-like domain
VFVEVLLLGAAFVIGFSTLWHGYKKHHHHWGTLVPFSVAMALFTANQFVKFPYSAFVFVVPAVVLILTAHMLNHRFCREANHCHTTDCNH